MRRTNCPLLSLASLYIATSLALSSTPLGVPPPRTSEHLGIEIGQRLLSQTGFIAPLFLQLVLALVYHFFLLLRIASTLIASKLITFPFAPSFSLSLSTPRLAAQRSSVIHNAALLVSKPAQAPHLSAAAYGIKSEGALDALATAATSLAYPAAISSPAPNLPPVHVTAQRLGKQNRMETILRQ